MDKRIIKFRGMDANGVMRYGRLSQDKERSTAYYNEYSQRICWDDSNVPVSNKSLGQFTGLSDKNGNEIYEGDIFAEKRIGMEDEPFGKVIFDTDLAAFTVEKSNGGWVYLSDFLLKEHHVRIIGNTYENPELLK